MLQLDSSNYEYVIVTIRNQTEPVYMNRRNGDKLMDYLTQSDIGKHVKLTDTEGMIKTVIVSDILSVEPEYQMKVELDESKYI